MSFVKPLLPLAVGLALALPTAAAAITIEATSAQVRVVAEVSNLRDGQSVTDGDATSGPFPDDLSATATAIRDDFGPIGTAQGTVTAALGAPGSGLVTFTDIGWDITAPPINDVSVRVDFVYRFTLDRPGILSVTLDLGLDPRTTDAFGLWSTFIAPIGDQPFQTFGTGTDRAVFEELSINLAAGEHVLVFNLSPSLTAPDNGIPPRTAYLDGTLAFSVAAVPLPAGVMLLLGGVGGLGALGVLRRRRNMRTA